MPAPSQPPNSAPIVGSERLTTAWQTWFSAIYRTVVPSGVFYIPAASGVPSGVPENRAGFVPMKYDTANDDLYVYNGGWVKVSLS